MEIDSAEENTALAEEISREYPDRSINFWMGLRDAQREGDWRLASNGLEPSFLNWHPGQPDNYENEDCAWFRTGSNVSNVWEKQWFDIKCNANANFGPFPIFLHALCEFEPPTGHPSAEDAITESTTEGESIQNDQRIQDIISRNPKCHVQEIQRVFIEVKLLLLSPFQFLVSFFFSSSSFFASLRNEKEKEEYQKRHMAI